VPSGKQSYGNPSVSAGMATAFFLGHLYSRINNLISLVSAVEVAVYGLYAAGVLYGRTYMNYNTID